MRNLLCFMFLCFAGPVSAELISIDFEFADRSLEFNGVTQNTGGIDMSIIVDTDTNNLGSGFGDFDNFYEADVFFTSAGLGLNNEQVLSDTFLYFGSTILGFTDTVNQFSTIFTAFVGSNLAFDSVFDLSTIVVPQGPIINTGNELRTANDILFANGDRITGGGTIGDTTVTITVSRVTSVSAPSVFALVSLSLIGLGFTRNPKISKS